MVALDPSTGAILAMVSAPSYDPNRLASHDTSQVVQARTELLDDAGRPLENRAIGGRLYPPGSVFKLVTAAAALESGIEGVGLAVEKLGNPLQTLTLLAARSFDLLILDLEAEFGLGLPVALLAPRFRGPVARPAPDDPNDPNSGQPADPNDYAHPHEPPQPPPNGIAPHKTNPASHQVRTS